jgi:hypothetical protein
MTERIHSRWKFCLTTTLLIIVTGTYSCNDSKRIVVPVCTCVLRGAVWTKDKNQNQSSPLPPGEDAYYVHNGNSILSYNVTELITKSNEDVWAPGADIALLELMGSDGEIQVIDDPDLTSGKYGEIVASTFGSSEGEEAARRCRAAAWGRAAIPDILVIVIARKLINSDGSSSPMSGISEVYNQVLKRNNGIDLCSFPRNLTKDDTKGKYIILTDPTLLGLDGSKGNGIPYVVLAHEFGHVLMLGHGDGLDNDNNSQLPPNPGPRLFDAYCDPAEYNNYDVTSSTPSLMIAKAGYIKSITILQKEIARTVASLMPAAFGSAP